MRSTTWLNDYLDWPHVGQVLELRRERTVRGKTTVEVVYGITSLRPEQAGARELLQLVRGHWSIENQLFGVKDTTLGEDACRVRTGAAPQVLAAVRNTAVYLLRRAKLGSIAAAIRTFAASPTKTASLLFRRRE